MLVPRRIRFTTALLIAAAMSASVRAQRPPDPTDNQKIAAPEEIRQVWKDFNAAVQAGDIEKALSFVERRSRLVEPLRQMGAAQLQKALANQVDVDCRYDFSYFAKCDVIVRISPESHQLFETRFVWIDGRWWIEEF